jgi:hypothetical protein
LREGIAWETLSGEIGEQETLELRRRAVRWTRAGLLEDDGERIRIAAKGLLVTNALILEMVGALEEVG